MRVIVQDEQNEFDQQTLAYAEYRAFSGLVAHDGDVAEVFVELTRLSRDDDEARHATIVCTIAVRMTSRDFDETSAVARHAYAAIDKAVSMIRRRSLRRAERLA